MCRWIQDGAIEPHYRFHLYFLIVKPISKNKEKSGISTVLVDFFQVSLYCEQMIMMIRTTTRMIMIMMMSIHTFSYMYKFPYYE
jgi:hypothetical protein